ncbi:MAG TPA: hypothetical protein VEK07_11870 [Polyangiaceae bacterium]|nr:hypothetical protein [Polyangiaceae bacterium]
MDMERHVGLTPEGAVAAHDRKALARAIAFKLSAMGLHVPDGVGDADLLELGRDLFARYREQMRLLSDHLCPVDRRIQTFIDAVCAPLQLPFAVRLPATTLLLDRFGLARELSLPVGADEWQSDIVSSYRLDNGVLHNPLNDRRTTQGVFHVAEFGLPVPGDKITVPLLTYAHLLQEALKPPPSLLRLPYAAQWPVPVELMASLLLRPLVCPAVPKVSFEKRMEVRFFAPGGLVSNLDFVESIFGNAGDPTLPENDAALDVDHWTGHTGCVILAPHLVRLRKKDVGLPHVSYATEAQKRDGMCWNDPAELYNDGRAFKVMARSMDGVMVTVLADNYFGYCKKEIKTQISFSANLYGLAEEEHAGGALAFATQSLGERFVPERLALSGPRFAEALERLGDRVTVHPSGCATDKVFPEIHYVPEDVEIHLRTQDVKWRAGGQEHHIKLLPGHHYVHPSGYRVRMEKHPAAPSWRLIGTAPEGTFCHKPCTVSGGGKSEISKSLTDAVIYGPIYVKDIERDLALVETIFNRDYREALRPERRSSVDNSRPLLSPERSLGSVVKLLTPSRDEFTPEYNGWLQALPNYIRALVFVVKRFYQPEWGTDWKRHFVVDIINGAPGHELRHDGRKLVGSYLRVGLLQSGAWRTYKLRQDFVAADKVQMEDDISASVVVPARALFGLPAEYEGHPSLKLSENCEFRLFQRPDDAIHPGFDRQTEEDMSGRGLFCSNFQSLTPADGKNIVEDVAVHEAFSDPMRFHTARNAKREHGFFVNSAKPRMVDGKPSKNPRYLQLRPDVARPRDRHLAEVSARLHRRIGPSDPVIFPVISVLSGRRNNPPDGAIRPLCVYGPIHYQELPELFMDYICSVTGKSPSTTGAGTEGALTKGPFNAICATADLNNAFVSMLLTGYAGFSSAAGYIGPNFRVDHDISLLVPEVWCRMFPHEREPHRLIREGHLEKLQDFEHKGKTVLASRLGYRITASFVHTFLGRVFDNPADVLTEEALRPETQSLDVFADGIDNIVDAQRRVAALYFEDGSIEDACPPLKALLHVMAFGHYKGKRIDDPELRAQFTRESLLSSDWYVERLRIKQDRDIALWQRHVRSLVDFLAQPGHWEEAQRLGIPGRLGRARAELARVTAPDYLATLQGTIGADAVHRTDVSHEAVRALGERAVPSAGNVHEYAE